ncbi:S26 family signal peptidase [Lysinibacillus sp. FSL H8-0500]|uniref:S26 family signal peptidase n=1 Tax=Lysinibacillus sp. FSL H8-0500 TaxID=2921393 RepID=UPI003100E036
MNDIKRALKEVLEDTKRFSQQSEDTVIQRIHQPQRKKWGVPLITVSFIALFLFFLGAYLWQPNQQAQFTRYFQEKMGDADYQVIFQEFNSLKDNDALVAFIQQEEDTEKIYLAYFDYQKKWRWLQTTGTQSKPYQGKESWTSTAQEPFMYAGVIDATEISQIIVGKQQATQIALQGNLVYWFAVSDKAARIIAKRTDNTWERLTELQSSNEPTYNIPIIDTLSDMQQVIELKTDTMDRGNREYYQSPIVIDPQFTKLERGDVITYTTQDGQQTISRVLGLPHETVEIINGTVVINTVSFAHPFMFATIMGETVYESYVEKLGNHLNNRETAKKTFFYSFPATQLSPTQIFVVPDNWARGAIEVISLEQVNGKVLGYQRQ